MILESCGEIEHLRSFTNSKFVYKIFRNINEDILSKENKKNLQKRLQVYHLKEVQKKISH
jgi:hypothetical protein